MERDFTDNGRMRPLDRDRQRALKGHLPLYSVDTREEATRLTHLAIAHGEFLVQRDGSLVAHRLRNEQNLQNFQETTEALERLHKQVLAG